MTRIEVAEMIEFAMACYPHVQIKEMKKTLDVWTELFASIDCEPATRAMKKSCQSNKYFPSVADVMLIVKEEKDFWRGHIKC